MSTQPSQTLRRLAAALAPLLLVGALTAACGGEADPADESSAEPTPATSSPDEPSVGASGSPSETSPAEPEEEGPQRIEVTLRDGSWSPLGERIEVGVGEPFVIVVTADEPGSLHVHSTPETEVDYQPGTTEQELTIDRPGVVEVESHDPTLVLVQLEVR